MESNLHYNTRRFYDPKIGRYITQDPIGFSGGMNLYRYANGNPINRIDPTGEIVPAVGAVVSRVVIAYASCVAICKMEHMIFNAINGCETDDNCFKDCLSPFVILTHGRAGKVARGKGMPVTNGPSGGKPKAPRTNIKTEDKPKDFINNDEVFTGKAPHQTTPGERYRYQERYNRDTKKLEESHIYYDQYGRQVKREDLTNHGYGNKNSPEYHSDPHTHTYEYGPGYGAKGKETRINHD